MGVDAMEPRVARALLDFVHRYTADVLLTAEAFAAAGDRPAGEVRAADVTLALQTQSASGAFCAPPAVADVAPLAAALNAVPLPPVQRRFGLRLPPEADCLTQPNWQVDLTEVGGAEETGVGAAGGTGGGAQQRAAGGRPQPAPPQPMPVRRTAAPVAPAQQQQQPAAEEEEDWEEGG
jgi:transcription initiation factor TFIID subunit 9B